MKPTLTRRSFVAAGAAAGVALATAKLHAADTELPAFLGGRPVRTRPFPAWPQFGDMEVRNVSDAIRSGNWFRGNGQNVTRFEQAYAALLGAKFCVGTSSGTNALIASLNALGVGPGDEVILPPYTFNACANAILMLGALPIFVDVDPATFQIDATKIEAAITERTAAIMPVHIGGGPCDIESVIATGEKHKLPVVEDACQAHAAEWKGRKLGTFGATGCFSFQASKNLTAGEGGAIITANEEVAETCYSAANNGHPRRAINGKAIITKGSNFRMSEFHAGILLAQMIRVTDQSIQRNDNAEYLKQQLATIPGIEPAKQPEGCTRNAYHLFMMRYKSDQFANLPRAKFLKALAAEGIRASSGYTPLNKEPAIAQTLESRGFKKCFPEDVLKNWAERTACPVNDALCEDAIWFSQNMLLDVREGMDNIVQAIRKISTHAGNLAGA